MIMSELQSHNRGNRADYVFGCSEGWDAFQVVRWHSIEEISRPFEYELTLLRESDKGPIHLDALVDTGASFRVATEARWRVVHGIVAEAEEIDRTSQLLLYRVLLVPHLWRSQSRRRCRTFVDQSLEQIVTAVLENRSPTAPRGLAGLEALRGAPEPPDPSPAFDAFLEPRGAYRWAVGDEARIRALRSYVVQYNETDYDFFARLLEQEGLSYFFEHTGAADLLVISDRPGAAPLFARDDTFKLRGAAQLGSSRDQEVIRALRDARRMRPRAVTMRDFAWRKSLTMLEAAAGEGADAAGHFEFPARDEDDPKAPGLTPARIRLERFEVERALRSGMGTVRTMEPGKRFKLTDEDALREDAELLIVRVETFATELDPQGLLDGEPFGFGRSMPVPAFESRFQALPADRAFRPERITDKPRILGIQSARVTAEETGAEPGQVHTNAEGQVRVRFPWDQRADDGTATSKWVRVAQYWAGPGFGALYTPRVGHEVLVAHIDGDPDRPVIIGRVYNPQNPPPYNPASEPWTSTIKSRSSEGEGSNEIRFIDLKGSEEVYLHAERDLNELIEGAHSTSVGGNQSNSVGANQANMVLGYRNHRVGGFEGNHIEGFRDTLIGGPDTLTVENRRDVSVDGDHTFSATGSYKSQANSNHEFRSTNAYFYPAGDFQVVSTTAGFNQTASFYARAAECTVSLNAGVLRLDNGAGASICLVGNTIMLNATVIMNSAGSAFNVVSGGPTNVVSGGPMNLGAGGDISATAPTIKLNG
jgi:type VI secretion system secreted protein VgrG